MRPKRRGNRPSRAGSGERGGPAPTIVEDAAKADDPEQPENAPKADKEAPKAGKDAGRGAPAPEKPTVGSDQPEAEKADEGPDPRVEELEQKVSDLTARLEGISEKEGGNVDERFQGMEDRMRSLLQLSEILSVRYNPFLEDEEPSLYDDQAPERFLPDPKPETRPGGPVIPFEPKPGAEVVPIEPDGPGPEGETRPAAEAAGMTPVIEEPETAPEPNETATEPEEPTPQADPVDEPPEPVDEPSESEASAQEIQEAAQAPQEQVAPEPVREPAPEPAPEPTPEPASEPVQEPTPEPASEPVQEPALEPAPEPTPEPAQKSAPEPAPEAVRQEPAEAHIDFEPDVEPSAQAAAETTRPAPRAAPRPAPPRSAYLALCWFERLAEAGDPAEIHLFLDHYERLGWVPPEHQGWMRALAEGIAPRRADLVWDDLQLTGPDLARLHREHLRFLESLFRSGFPEDNPDNWERQADHWFGGR